MEIIKHIAAGVFIFAGAFFLLIGSIGLIRLPDFYSRTHATGKSDTLGILLILVGMVITQGFFSGNHVNSFKLLIIIVFVALTNPTATNALSRAALKFRQVPWFKGEKMQKESE